MSKTAPRYRNRKLRHLHLRRRLAGNAARPRLAVFRSARHIYAQAIDDDAGSTLTASLEMTLGFSQPIKFQLPATVQATVENNNQIILTSHDKVLLGQTCAKIRAFRPPEPYQGKGVLYAGEQVRRKAGKAGKKLA